MRPPRVPRCLTHNYVLLVVPFLHGCSLRRELFKGTLYADRMPIGLPRVITDGPPERVRLWRTSGRVETKLGKAAY